MIKFLILLLFVNISSSLASPSKDDFFNTLYSQGFFLEQCIAKNIIRKTDIHNKTMEKANSLGYGADTYWDAGQKGAKGYVFDMINNKWVKASFTKVNCNFIINEQKKFYKSISRY